MVLGIRNKTRKNASVQVDYVIHVQEVKPWPPSQSLRTLRSALIQWEHGDRSSGSTNPVIPSLGSGAGEGKIEFNESFRLHTTLLREMSTRGGECDTFQKNCLEFNLYEPRRDRTVKGQLLGTAVIDLAEYGVVKEAVSISAPMNCHRNFRNMAQPFLFIKIQPVLEKGRTSSSSRDSLSKEAPLERSGVESVSSLMNEEYTEEAEIASFSDDDASSHSALAVSSIHESNGGPTPQKRENGSEKAKNNSREAKEELALGSKQGFSESDMKPVIEQRENMNGSSSCFSTLCSSSDLGTMGNGHAASSECTEPTFKSFINKIVAHGAQPLFEPVPCQGTKEKLDANVRNNGHDDVAREIHEKASDARIDIRGNVQGSTGENMSSGLLEGAVSLDTEPVMTEELDFTHCGKSQVNGEDDEKSWSPEIKCSHATASGNVILSCSAQDSIRKHRENGEGRLFVEEEKHFIEDELSQDDARKVIPVGSESLSLNRENYLVKNNVLNGDRLKHVRSVRSAVDSGRNNGLNRSHQFVKDGSVLGNAQNGAGIFASYERKDAKVYPKETRNIYSDGKIQRLEERIKILEGELRETAAIEVGLYSVVAEHGSSMSKVLAPARRLSRLCLHAYKENSPPRGASAARSAVSGLVLVAKACGNDVPRLTFWLSNSVVFRAIIVKAFEEHQILISAGHFVEMTGSWKGNKKSSSSLKWKESSLSKDHWEDPHYFISALEKVEAWIFSRIVESVWWQTLTPHMQSAATKTINGGMASDSSKKYQKTSISGDHEQINFSLELWKGAFKDACERLCPVRAGGHECGCLPFLTRLIMEQCVARLDVAMFNAILRESDDDIPTDPVSDPISDVNVLPIPAGKASFGTGAQLKNAIGNWSRWLTDLFGIDDDNSFEDENNYESDVDNEKKEDDASFKSFHFLNALSDLMMLPKDMLLSRSIRKEVCPTLGAPLIRRVLNHFVPDEFCSDPIPEVVLEALDSEDNIEAGEVSVTSFPCTAAPAVYLPPSAASLAGIIGETRSQSRLRRSGSSVLRKSYTSDDELDELDSPLASIIDRFRNSTTPTKPRWMSKEHGSRNAVRYQLLREVWMRSE